MKINSISKVRLKATYLPTKARHEASSNALARIYGADPKVIDAGLHFLPSQGNSIAEARNIVTAGKKQIIAAARDEDGARIKSALKPMGSDNIGWYYADADDAPAIREISDNTERKLAECKHRIAAEWPDLVAEGRALLGSAVDSFVYPELGDYLAKAHWGVTIRNGSIDFDNTVFDALPDELAAQIRADQQIEKEQLVESHRASVNSFFDSVICQVGKVEASLKKGNRLRPEGFDTLLDEARDLERDNWLGDRSISKIAAAFGAVLRNTDGLWADDQSVAHDERAAKAAEIRSVAVDSIELAKSIGI